MLNSLKLAKQLFDLELRAKLEMQNKPEVNKCLLIFIDFLKTLQLFRNQKKTQFVVWKNLEKSSYVSYKFKVDIFVTVSSS